MLKPAYCTASARAACPDAPSAPSVSSHSQLLPHDGGCPAWESAWAPEQPRTRRRKSHACEGEEAKEGLPVPRRAGRRLALQKGREVLLGCRQRPQTLPAGREEGVSAAPLSGGSLRGVFCPKPPPILGGPNSAVAPFLTGRGRGTSLREAVCAVTEVWKRVHSPTQAVWVPHKLPAWHGSRRRVAGRSINPPDFVSRSSGTAGLP